MEKPSFDLEKVYDDEIAPLMTKIIDLCKAHQLPMFATFLYKNDVENEDDGCCTSFLMCENRPIPQSMMDLRNFSKAASALRMQVRNKEGAVTEDIVILGGGL